MLSTAMGGEGFWEKGEPLPLAAWTFTEAAKPHKHTRKCFTG